MSLNLPYPDLEFVPLDVLTAGEMNQIVANYEYISSQFPITKSGKNIDMYNTGSTAVYDTRLTSDAGNLQINGKRALTTDDLVCSQGYRLENLNVGDNITAVCSVDLSAFPNDCLILLVGGVSGTGGGILNGLHARIGSDGLEMESCSTWGMSVAPMRVIRKTNAINSFTIYARKDNSQGTLTVTYGHLIAIRVQ